MSIIFESHCRENIFAWFVGKYFTNPARYSGITEMRSTAPAEAGQDDNEGDGVEDGGHQGVDHLHLEEGEGQLDLDEVPDLEQVEEGPEDADDEACHHHKQEPVIVTNSKNFISKLSVDGWSSTGHADHSQNLNRYLHEISIFDTGNMPK